MTDENKKSLKQEYKKVSAPLTSSHHRKLGGWKTLQKPAATFSFVKKLKRDVAKQEIKGVAIEMPLDKMVNDNSIANVFLSRLRAASLVIAAFILGAVLGINSGAFATQAVLHADDTVLSTAMDISPDALGLLLNEMNIGE